MEPARVPRTRDYALRRAAAATNTSFFVAQARERAAARAGAKTRARKQRRAWDDTPATIAADRQRAHDDAVERRRNARGVPSSRPQLPDPQREIQRIATPKTSSMDLEDVQAPWSRTPAEKTVTLLDDAFLEGRRAAAKRRAAARAPRTPSAGERSATRAFATPADAERTRRRFPDTSESEAPPSRPRWEGTSNANAAADQRTPPRRRSRASSGDASSYGGRRDSFRRTPRRTIVRDYTDDSSECVGEAAGQRGRGYTSAHVGMRTRGTSPFDDAKVSRSLAAYDSGTRRAELGAAAAADPFSREAARAYSEYAAAEAAALPTGDEPTALAAARRLAAAATANATIAADAQKAHIGVISDVGAMARAVSGLVDMAAKQVSRSDALALGGGENGAPADLQAWQRSVEHRLQHTLQQQHQHLLRQLRPERPPQQMRRPFAPANQMPPPPPMCVPAPADSTDLLDKLFSKICDIEQAETDLLDTVSHKPRKRPAPLPPPENDTIRVPADVAAHLGIPKPDVEFYTPPEIAKPVMSTAPLNVHAKRCDVPPRAAGKIMEYRDAVLRAAELNSAELFGTGLTQPQIIEALAEELLDAVFAEATGELDLALDECSQAILNTA
jgi:hypothetical protein